MNPDVRRLRPMGIADILDETVELYKNSFVLLVGIAAVMQVPYAILMQAYVVNFSGMTASTTSGAAPTPTQILTVIGVAILGFGYLVVTAPLVTAALTYAISERYLGRKPTILGSFKQVFNLSILGQMIVSILLKAAAILVAYVVLCIGIFGAAMFATFSRAGGVLAVVIGVVFAAVAVVGGGYVLLRLAIMEPSIMVERRGIGHALNRSWSSMPGSMAKCLGLVLIVSIVTGLLQGVLGTPTQMMVMERISSGETAPFWLIALNAFLSAAVGTIFAPVMCITLILLYYDIRIRKEGFDIELLARELNAKSQQETASQFLPQEQTPVEQVSPTDEGQL